MSKNQLEDCKKLLRSLLISSKQGVKTRYIEKEYFEFTLEPMPYKAFNFHSARPFIVEMMMDTARLARDSNGDEVFIAIADESTRHIAELVMKQRSKKPRKNATKKKYPSARSYGFNRVHSLSTMKPAGYNNNNNHQSSTGRPYQASASHPPRLQVTTSSSALRPPRLEGAVSSKFSAPTYPRSAPQGSLSYGNFAKNDNTGFNFSASNNAFNPGFKESNGPSSSSYGLFQPATNNKSNGLNNSHLVSTSISGFQNGQPSSEPPRRQTLLPDPPSRHFPPPTLQPPAQMASKPKPLMSQVFSQPPVQAFSQPPAQTFSQPLAQMTYQPPVTPQQPASWTRPNANEERPLSQLSTASYPSFAPSSRNESFDTRQEYPTHTAISANQIMMSGNAENQVNVKKASERADVEDLRQKLIRRHEEKKRQLHSNDSTVSGPATASVLQGSQVSVKDYKPPCPPLLINLNTDQRSTLSPLSPVFNYLPPSPPLPEVEIEFGADNNVDPELIKERVVTIVNARPSGLMASHLRQIYYEKYSEEAPEDILDLIRGFSGIAIEKSPAVGDILYPLRSDNEVIATSGYFAVAPKSSNPKLQAASYTTLSPQLLQSQLTTTSTIKAPSINKPTPVLQSQQFPADQQLVDVQVSYVCTTTSIAVQLIQLSGELEKLEKILLSRKTKPLISFDLNRLCICEFPMENTDGSIEQRGIRAKIVEVLEDNKVLVQFLDHGECGCMEKSSLFDFPAECGEFTALPLQAISCELTGLKEFSSDNRCYELLEKHLLGIICRARIDTRVPNISLTLVRNEDDDNINDSLLTEFLTPQLSLSDWMKAYLVCASEEGKLYFHIPRGAGDGISRLQELSVMLTDYMSRNNPINILATTMEPGTRCAVVASSSGEWSRAEILRENDDRVSTVLVQYIDYGDTEEVPVSYVYQLPTEFMSLPAQALRCQLKNLPPQGATWTKEALNYFHELVPSDEPVNVILVASTDDNEQAASEASDEFDHTNTIDISVGNHESISTVLQDNADIWNWIIRRDNFTNQPANAFDMGMVDHRPRAGEKVYITWASDPHNFRGIEESSSNKVKNMNEQLRQYYRSMRTAETLSSVDIRTDCLYAGLHNDNLWYRVSIIRALPEPFINDTFQVQLVDVGLRSYMSLSNIRPLLKEFSLNPCLVVNMKLHCTPRSGSWTKEECEAFCLATQKSIFNIDVINDDGEILSVILLDITTGKPVHELLGLDIA